MRWSGDGRVLSITLVGLFFGVMLSLTSFSGKIDLSFYDFTQSRLSRNSPPRTVVVAVDEKTSEAFGWPIGKDIFAALIALLSDAGAERIGFDLFFTDRFESCIESNDSSEDSFSKEELLGATAAATGAVLSSYVLEVPAGYRGVKFATPQNVVSGCTERNGDRFLKKLVPGVEKREPAIAHAHADPSEIDGVVRTIQPCVPLHDGCVADIATAMIGKLRPGERCGESLFVPFFFSYEEIPHISMADVISGSDSAEELQKLSTLVRDRFVLVAATDPTLKDVGPTPRSGNEPLVMVHVNRVEALLQDIGITAVPRWVGWIIAGILAVLISLLGGRIRFLLAAIVLSGAVSFVAAFLLLRGAYLFVPVSSLLWPLCASLGSAAGYAGWRHFLFNRTLSEAFDSYVSPEILSWLKETGGAVLRPDAAERREITVLFSDIAGYTSLSNALDADSVIRSLRYYLDTMLMEVQRHAGYVDKINGDGLMILFGAPKRSGRHAQDAFDSAQEMMRRTEEMQEAWRQLTGRSLAIRIGIATGKVLVGNLGGKGHIEYSAIGRDVNLAARLESGSEVGGILISEETFHALEEKPSGWWRKVSLKGYEEAVRVFQIPPCGSDQSARFDRTGVVLSLAFYERLKDRPPGTRTTLTDRTGTEEEVFIVDTNTTEHP